MNVTCVRCGTEYEFDDALVSERGTTVRCTRCSFEFRVRPARTAERKLERWTIRKHSGEEYDFVSLMDLQQAIQLRRVSAEDELSRDGHSFRKLIEVEEFEAFFEPSQRRMRGAAGAGFARGSGLGTTRAVPSTQQTLPGPPVAPRVTPEEVSAPRPIERSLIAQPAEPDDGPLEEEITKAYQAFVDEGEAEPGWPGDEPSSPSPAEFLSGPGSGSPQPAAGGASIGPSTRRKRARVQYAAAPVPAPSHSESVRPPPVGFASRSLPVSIAPPSSRSAGAPRWIGALVLLGGAALLAGTAGRSYLKQFVGVKPKVVEQDTRGSDWVARGQELLRSGDLEGAKAEFAKASALSERDPESLAGLLKVELAHADALWFQLVLADPAQPAVRTRTESLLQARFARLRAAAEALQGVAGSRSDLLLLIADALRIQGNVVAARKLMEGAGELGSEPEAVYVLALLDAAEAHPSWPAIVGRLSRAALAERGLARAHMALIYALGASGDFAEARQQLAAFATQAEYQTQFEILRAYIERLNPTPANPETSDPSSNPKSAQRAVDETPAVSVGHGDALTQAADARKALDWPRAARFYTLALSGSPGNVEAMTGLGDVARAEGKNAVAASHYSAALRQSGSYAPALRGLGDLQWASGDRASAVELYRRLPSGQAGSTVEQRLAEFDAQSGSPAVVAPPSVVAPASTSAQGVTPNDTDRPVSPSSGRSPASEVDTQAHPE
jgi:predicted Zn finger-like uncharacterized protein